MEPAGPGQTHFRVPGASQGTWASRSVDPCGLSGSRGGGEPKSMAVGVVIESIGP